jgi:hypothetical protein
VLDVKNADGQMDNFLSISLLFVRIKHRTLTHFYPFPVPYKLKIISISHAHRIYLKGDSSRQYAKTFFWSYSRSNYNV